MSVALIFWFALSVLCDVSGQLCFKTGADRLPADGPLLGRAGAFLGVTLASATILREKVGRPQWLGAWLVTIGVAIVAGSA
jgi:drug/metabolite transporter (DMT)-like permease